MPERPVGCSAHGYFPARECSYCSSEWTRKSRGNKPRRLVCKHGYARLASECRECRAVYNKRYNEKRRAEKLKFIADTARLAERENREAELAHKNDLKKTAPWNAGGIRAEAAELWAHMNDVFDRQRTPCFEKPELYSDYDDPEYPEDATGNPFPSSGEAEALCAGCPLFADGSCLKYALAQKEDSGVWGGKRIVRGRIYRGQTKVVDNA